jgi:serine/threonine-protein kinase
MDLIGRLIGGRYKILEKIGSGGMSVVYKAECTLLNRPVAIKVLKDELQFDGEFVKRFYVESQASAKLSHPNIVSIYDVGKEDGINYIVLEYIEGKTLKKIIEERKLTWQESVNYAIQIAKALEHAHKKSIIHKDIKPQNIIITPENLVKVTDFGIAGTSLNSNLTVEINTVGSVLYFSPEQARGSYTDEKSDIYSLGVVMYEMTTGKVPFDGDSAVSIAIKHLQDSPMLPRLINPDIPPDFEKIILKSMAKNRDSRYKSATDVIADLEKLLVGESVEAKNDVEPPNFYSETIKIPSIHVKHENQKDSPEKPKKEESDEKLDKKAKAKKIVAIALGFAAAFVVIFYSAFRIFPVFGMNLKRMIFGGEIEVPDLIGKKVDDMLEKYNGSNFRITKIGTVEDSQEEGTIITQSPEVGKKVKNKVKTEILVKTSTGETSIKMPDYTRYKDYREAQLELESMGFHVLVNKENSDNMPINSIIRQFPPGSTRIAKGSEIVFYVSSGPAERKEETKDEAPQAKEDAAKADAAKAAEKDKATSVISPKTDTNAGEKPTQNRLPEKPKDQTKDSGKTQTSTDKKTQDTTKSTKLDTPIKDTKSQKSTENKKN